MHSVVYITMYFVFLCIFTWIYLADAFNQRDLSKMHYTVWSIVKGPTAAATWLLIISPVPLTVTPELPFDSFPVVCSVLVLTPATRVQSPSAFYHLLVLGSYTLSGDLRHVTILYLLKYVCFGLNTWSYLLSMKRLNSFNRNKNLAMFSF